MKSKIAQTLKLSSLLITFSSFQKPKIFFSEKLTYKVKQKTNFMKTQPQTGSGRREKDLAHIHKSEVLLSRQREGKFLTFWEKQRLQREAAENRKRNLQKKK